MKTLGQRIIDAVIKSGAIQRAIVEDGAGTIFVWSANAEEQLEAAFGSMPATPDASLPPLDPDAPKRKMIIEVEVAEDFEKRLDNQWMVEREIHADRWSWRWA